MTVDIICADARDGLARFPDGHFHCCVTSPPFWGLRDYGLGPDALGLEPTPELYVEHLVSVLREVRRVLRPDGTLWLNLGDSYTSGGRKDRDPALVSESSGLTNRSSGLDRAPTPLGLKPKDLVGVPWRVAFALRADGWWLRSDIVWSKPNPMPESVTDRPTRSHEMLFLLTKSARYYYDQDAIREPHTDESAKRYLRNSSYTGDPNATQYAMKQGPRGHGMPSQKWEADEADAIAPTWVKGHSGYVNADGHVMINEAGRNRRSVWEIATQPYAKAHFATFPEKLVEPCILTTSEWGCCPECGAPWERVVETRRPPTRQTVSAGPYGDHGKLGTERWDEPIQTTTVGWRPTCKHGAAPDALEIIETPTGGRVGSDPSLVTGRAGYNRPRGPAEGTRPITRYEQRRYASQLKASAHRDEMEAEGGSAFAHYIRTDRSGARPLPPELLEPWIERGWLERVAVPAGQHLPPSPCRILDPFSGSGTVGLVAERLGRHSVLIDAKEEYCEMARHRTAQRGLMVMTSRQGEN